MKRIVLIIGAIFLGLALKAQSLSYSCRYWFDQNHAQAVTTTFDESGWDAELDVGSLSEGLHTLFLQISDTSLIWNSPRSYLFYKIDTIIGYTYRCWFDQDIEHQRTGSLGDGHILLDVESLSDDLHTLNIILEGSAMGVPKSYMFMKVAVQDPNANIQYHCWFDDDCNSMQTGSVGTGLFELEVGNLSNGLHTVNIQLDNGIPSVPQCYMFYKRPVGGYIAKWEYWLNDEINNRHTTNLSPFVDTLDIITLLPLETKPIRSTCFHFHPNGDEPYINAKNKIGFRFWNTDDRFIEQSAYYVDENVFEPIAADTLERNTTVSIAAPRDNQIHWFKLNVGRGDYLSFQADKACTMQLFAPYGEEIYAVSGPESIVLEGLNVWEDGTYYLAVHDVTGSGETVSITYNWLNRYTVASYNVHLVGNGGCSTITFQGNGFNSLLDAYLVNYQNDTIRQLDIGHESNATTTISFNFYQENLGAYDAVFEFFEETIRIHGALEVQEPVDILLTSSVSYPSSFMSGTTVTYNFTITNNGNMSAYVVPIYLYISSPTKESITHLKIEGLELPSILDGIDMDSLSTNDRMWLQEWAEELGDDHYFFKMDGIDEMTGDSIFIRSNYFFVDIAPFETKSIKLKITATTGAHQPIEAWMTVPNESYSPLVISPEGGFRGGNRGYCCAQEQIQCTLDLICSSISIASIVPAWAAPLAVAGCVCGLIAEIVDVYSFVFCEGDTDLSFWEKLKNMKKSMSIIDTVVSCIKKNNPVGKIVEILDAIDAVLKGLTLGDITHDVSDCIEKWKNKNPNCPPGPPHGGGSDGQAPGDPNDIYGYLSESGSHYMRQEIQNVQYEIEFENDTTLATAAAHTIIVRDTLDAAKFDLNSLAARSVTIGDKRLDLNGEQTFARTLDLRPEIYVIAQVNQDYDPTTGIIQWTIQSLDPMTMEPTDDPNQGVLPVNYFGDGVGFIDYSVNLLQAFDDGTEISNRAGIIFDQENVIMTPTWTNIVDAVKPTSHIENVVVENDTLNFSFVSSDSRSGVWYHSLYYRNDSTAMEWQVKKAQIVGNSYMLPLDSLLTTEYLVKAVDSAGNVEDKEMVAEYTYYSNGPAVVTQANTLAQGWNWWSTYVEMNGVNGLTMLENSLGHNGLTIKSQNDFTDNYYQDMGYDYWYGSLENIQNEQGYLINVSAACNATLTGRVANPALHPITIQPNWNWIGYPVASPQAVTNALSGFNAEADDVVKGQSDFTSYYEGYGWYPEDFMMIPGQSYLYYSNATANKTLTYANGTRGGMLRPARESYWKNDAHAFADNLNVMAVVSIDNEEQRDENLELGAFVNGECRGSVRLRHFAPLDRYYAMLTVNGQDGDFVGFRLIHSESLEENETCGNHLVFSKNAIVGSLGKPYEIRFGEAEDAMVDMVLYPNPVERGATFSLMIPSGETVTEVFITDVVGNQLRHETGAINAKSIKGLPTAGVYVIKAVAKSGNTYHGRLIVE